MAHSNRRCGQCSGGHGAAPRLLPDWSVRLESPGSLGVVESQLVRMMLVTNLAWHRGPGVMQSPGGTGLIIMPVSGTEVFWQHLPVGQLLSISEELLFKRTAGGFRQ